MDSIRHVVVRIEQKQGTPAWQLLHNLVEALKQCEVVAVNIDVEPEEKQT